ncbi:uncharacterized protein LOC117126859 [Brassica rapa]|uniref:uncharacterized protein LOC117126859 n=1 Tax=Brassica campestris TaxID=3711 RepID=UPI00142D8328|nr:uncharacterized protein LOC117126859 [Brassica rapa]
MSLIATRVACERNYAFHLSENLSYSLYPGDDEEETEDRKIFSDDEEYKVFRDFKIQAWKNRVFFEEDPFRSIFPLTDLEEPWIDMTTREYLESIVSLCVKKLNEEKHPDGPLMEYQAKAMDFGGKPPFPILCRPASTIS